MRLLQPIICSAASPVICMVAVLLTMPLRAATVTAELQRTTRAASFEVVMHKVENPQITYEKPLPLDLIPFQQRNDLYWSIGTAFAIGPNTFVSAAHVLVACIGSQMGEPELRDSSNKVYAIDKILKFSAHEDFVVFSLRAPPTLVPLITNTTPQVDDEVYAVGNALGDGIVIRNGLYTSATPEAQDGLWKWIRFSAAASPGNSGGPLLDTNGRVIGIVIGKSENENLNYALPIAQVLQAAEKVASFDERSSYSNDILKESVTAVLKTNFALPKSFSEFVPQYRRVMLEHEAQSQKQLLTTYAKELLPLGKGVDSLLTNIDAKYFPQLVAQQKNHDWKRSEPDEIKREKLDGKGFLQYGHIESISMLRLHRPDNDSSDILYNDSKYFMDLLLKGNPLTRPIGTEEVRVTSLGKAQLDEVYVDSYGRKWQLRSWPVTFLDSQLLTMLLPTPEGYAGVTTFSSGSTYDVMLARLRTLSDYVHVSYSGTLPQWQAFLKRKPLLPKLLTDMQLSGSGLTGTNDNTGKIGSTALYIKSSRMTVEVPNDLFGIKPATLAVVFGLEKNNNQLLINITGFDFLADEDASKRFTVMRHPKPLDDDDAQQQREWQELSSARVPYDGIPHYDRQDHYYWVSKAINLPAPTANKTNLSAVLYSVSYSTKDDTFPGQLETTMHNAIKGIHILEQ